LGLLFYHQSRTLARRKHAITTRISIPFAEVDFYPDVTLPSQEKVEAHKENTGFLAYYVLKEVVAL